MPSLRAFVSSTCYDLNILRGELRSFLIAQGHEPMMSDYNDLLFDPRLHTHDSCVKEVSNADVVILVIGSRFGGKALPSALSAIDLEAIKGASKSNKMIEVDKQISITQVEILKAVELDIPIYTFIDSRVLHDHHFYEKNKDKGILDKIDFPSIDKKENAVYIFEFINFIRNRSKNNSIVEFSKMADIEEYMKKQLSALLQRLLSDQRLRKLEVRKIDGFSEELKDIKSLILTSLASGPSRDVGRGVLRFRRLIDFMFSIDFTKSNNLLLENISWFELLSNLNISQISSLYVDSRYRPSSYIVKSDGTFFEVRFGNGHVEKFPHEWDAFKELPLTVKKDVLIALSENFNSEAGLRQLKYRPIQFDEFIRDNFEGKSVNDLSQEKGDTSLEELTFV